MADFKLENPAFAEAASRRQAKLQTNSNVPAYRQAGKAQNSKPYDLDVLDSMGEKSKLPFEFIFCDCLEFRV
jgi:hypothetical protein